MIRVAGTVGIRHSDEEVRFRAMQICNRDVMVGEMRRAAILASELMARANGTPMMKCSLPVGRRPDAHRRPSFRRRSSRASAPRDCSILPNEENALASPSRT